MITSPPHSEVMMEIYNMEIPPYEFAYGEVADVINKLPHYLGFGNTSIVVELDEQRVLAMSHRQRSETFALEVKYLADILHEVLRHTDEYYSPQFLSTYSGTLSIFGFPGSIRERVDIEGEPTIQEFIDFTNWTKKLLRSMGRYGNQVYLDMQINPLADPPSLGPNLVKDKSNRLVFVDALQTYAMFNTVYVPMDIDGFLKYAVEEVPNLSSESLDYLRDRLEKLEEISFFFRCLPYQLINWNDEITRISSLSDVEIDGILDHYFNWQDLIQCSPDWLEDVRALDDDFSPDIITEQIKEISATEHIPYYLRNVFKDGIANARRDAVN